MDSVVMTMSLEGEISTISDEDEEEDEEVIIDPDLADVTFTRDEFWD